MANLSTIRQKINENSMVVSIVMGVVVIVGIWLVLKNSGLITPKPTIPNTYFVDLDNNNEILQRPANEIPPLIGKNGKASVVGVVFYTCTTCADKKPAYFMKYSDEAKAAIDAMVKGGPSSSPNGPPPGMALQQGQLICAPEGIQEGHWVQQMSQEGSQILTQAHMRCGADAAAQATFKICPPGE